jgi:hypothetical protein
LSFVHSCLTQFNDTLTWLNTRRNKNLKKSFKVLKVFKHIMPNIRSEDQVMIGCWCDEDFVAKIDSARKHISRSQFCRDALREYLQGLGLTIPIESTVAPARTGKGRPPSKNSAHRTRVSAGPEEKSAVVNVPLVSSEGVDFDKIAAVAHAQIDQAIAKEKQKYDMNLRNRNQSPTLPKLVLK